MRADVRHCPTRIPLPIGDRLTRHMTMEAPAPAANTGGVSPTCPTSTLPTFIASNIGGPGRELDPFHLDSVGAELALKRGLLCARSPERRSLIADRSSFGAWPTGNAANDNLVTPPTAATADSSEIPGRLIMMLLGPPAARSNLDNRLVCHCFSQ